jgi:hypothetical protein
MNFYKLIKFCNHAFSKENELELNAIFVCGLKKYAYMKERKPKYTGIFFQSFLFFYRVLRDITFFEKKKTSKPIYVFSGISNQFDSIRSTLEALKANGIEFYSYLFKNTLRKNSSSKESIIVKFNLRVVLVSFILFFLRAFPFYLKLKKENKKIETSWYFSVFCRSYIFLPFFLDSLKKINPKLVVISNDHSVYSRCLRLSAEILDIKTLYIQHACVTDLFPPLEFNYALLDGRISHQIYQRSYKIRGNKNFRIKKNLSKCHVILSGQKKIILDINQHKNLDGLTIGLAVNLLDDFKCVKSLLDHLAKFKIKCIVRTHPSQNLIFLKKLKSYLTSKNWIEWSYFKQQSLEDYLFNLNVLVAGNSSIHLEAAQAGLPTFYYEMNEEVMVHDYYGFVKNCLSVNLKKNFSINNLNLSIQSMKNNKLQRNKVIKNYSETYDTTWQNREGELSGIIIDCILKNKPLNHLFKTQHSSIYKSLSYLR